MSTKLKHQQQGEANAVVPLSRCACDGCNKKQELQNFCKEHFDWFKWGMLTKEGKKPVDFDKKYQAFMRNKAA